MKTIMLSFLSVLLAAFLSGCAGNPDLGMVAGGVVGGVAGSALTSGSTAGTIAGAVVGGVAGRELSY